MREHAKGNRQGRECAESFWVVGSLRGWLWSTSPLIPVFGSPFRSRISNALSDDAIPERGNKGATMTTSWDIRKPKPAGEVCVYRRASSDGSKNIVPLAETVSLSATGPIRGGRDQCHKLLSPPKRRYTRFRYWPTLLYQTRHRLREGFASELVPNVTTAGMRQPTNRWSANTYLPT